MKSVPNFLLVCCLLMPLTLAQAFASDGHGDGWSDSIARPSKTNLHERVQQAIKARAHGKLEQLLNQGYAPNLEVQGRTALLTAVYVNDAQAVAMLLAAGADANQGYKNQLSPLMVAVRENGVEVGRLLIDAGAEVNFRGPEKTTALQGAVIEGHAEFVQLLLSAGAEKAEAFNGENLVALAVRKNHPQVLEVLLKAGLSLVGLLPEFATRGDAQGVELLLSAGALINERVDKYLHTALMRAAREGYREVAQRLLKAGADADLQDSDGWTALYHAARRGQLPVVKLLAEHSADLELATNGGWTPLMTAASKGHEDVLAYLMQVGADIHALSDKNWSVLAVAANAGQDGVVRTLLMAGADIDARAHKGWTALSAAAYNGYAKVVSILLRHNPDLEQRAQSFRRTALMIASQRGHEEIAGMLINYEAALNTRDRDGRTAVYLAANQGHLSIVSTLINAGAEYADALVKASEKGELQLVETFLAAGANPNQVNEKGVAPIHRAARKARLSVVKALVKAGARVDLAEHEKRHTALMRAAVGDDLATVKWLVQQGADIHARTSEGWTPLLFAARYAGVDVLQYFHQRGAELAVENRAKWTPLMVAVRGGHADNVAYLLKYGADFRKRNRDRGTALTIARQRGYEDIHQQLRQHEIAHTDYTPWLSSADYQAAFDRHKNLGRYPEDVQARMNDGHEQYRARFLLFPQNSFRYYSYSRMSAAFLAGKEQELAQQGFRLTFKNQFQDLDNVTRYQGTWVRLN